MLEVVSGLEKVRRELERYSHPLLDFSAREREGTLELIIDLKNKPDGIHTYYLEIHPRDLANTQFPWTLQRMIFDGLHDISSRCSSIRRKVSITLSHPYDGARNSDSG